MMFRCFSIILCLHTSAARIIADRVCGEHLVDLIIICR